MDSSSRSDFIRNHSDERLLRAYSHPDAGPLTKKQVALEMQARSYCMTRLNELICYAYTEHITPSQRRFITGESDSTDRFLIRLFYGLNIDIKTVATAANLLQKRPICDLNKDLTYCNSYKKSSESTSLIKKARPREQLKVAKKIKVDKKSTIKKKTIQIKWAKNIISKAASSFSKNFPKEISYEKGRYETTAEHQQRLKGSWTNEHLYFDVEHSIGDFDYDADRGVLTVFFPVNEVLYFADDAPKAFGDSYITTENEKKSNLMGLSDFFVINYSVEDHGSYVASNAYGAKVEVSRKTLRMDYVYISNLTRFISNTNIDVIEKKGVYSGRKRGLTKSLSIPRSKIESVEKNIGLRIVTKKSNGIVDYIQRWSEVTAKIDSPMEAVSYKRFMRSELIGMVLYNKKTKEIYDSFRL